MRHPSVSDKTEPLALHCTTASHDGVPDCSAGALGRLCWVLGELRDIIRAHRNARTTGHVPDRGATS